MWVKAAPGNQQLMVRAQPKRFFVPPYVGPSGWVGVWLDGKVDWEELAGLLEDSYRHDGAEAAAEGAEMNLDAGVWCGAWANPV